MTDLGYMLRIELNRILDLMPYLERHAVSCYEKVKETGNILDLSAYMESYWKWFYTRERMDWITEVLGATGE